MALESNGSDQLVVKSVGGSLAEQDGVQVGDVLTDVDGASVSGMTSHQATDLIAGPPESNVQLRFNRNGKRILIATPREKLD